MEWGRKTFVSSGLVVVLQHLDMKLTHLWPTDFWSFMKNRFGPAAWNAFGLLGWSRQLLWILFQLDPYTQVVFKSTINDTIGLKFSTFQNIYIFQIKDSVNSFHISKNSDFARLNLFWKSSSLFLNHIQKIVTSLVDFGKQQNHLQGSTDSGQCDLIEIDILVRQTNIVNNWTSLSW